MLLTYAKKSMYNLSAYGFAGISSRLINFLFLPYFLSKLTLSELGIWEWYQSWFSLGVFLLSSCAATGMIRFALLYVDDEQKQRQAIGNAFLLVTLLSCAIACVVYTLLYFDLFLSKDSYSYITLINAILFAFFSLELAYWRMHENLKLYITIFLAQSLISTILTIVWLNFSYGINAFFYAVLFSLIPFFVVFFLIFKNYFVFDWSLAKLQLYYAGPILVHGLLYVLLYNIDRWAIMHSQGFAVLGAYGLLWRFGSIFQTLTIAINDTWPIVCLKAYNEFNNSLLLKKLVIYFSLLLISCYIGVLVISIELFKLSTPFNYHYLVAYLPFLFIFVLLSAFAQLFTIGSVLIRKTNMLPWLTGGTVLLQYVFLNSIASYGIGAICFGNSIVFLLYCVLNGWMGWRLCPAIINVLVLQKITVLFFIFFALLQVTLILQLSFFIRVFILLLWPSAVYYSKLLDDEFSWLSLSIKNFCIQQGVRFFTIKKKKSNSPMQHIFYLRADHCYGQTKIGGSVAHTLGVLKAWVATGIHVTVASSEMHTILSEINDIHFFPLTIWPGFCWLRWRFSYIRWRLECFFSNLFFFLQLKKWLLTTNSFDAIYQRYSLLSFLGLLVARFKKVPLILEYNGSEVWAYRVWSEKCWMRFEWLAEIIEEINLRAAERIIVVSEVIKEELRSLGIEEKKILVSPNGVDIAIYDPVKVNSERLCIRKKLNLEERYVFGFVGTFSYWHGIEVLSYMIPKLAKLTSKIHFLLVGDGPLKKILEKELEEANINNEYVTFTGAIAHELVPSYLATCDAFLCPTQPNSDGSRFFGSPIKLFEYLSMSKPIIASELEQLKEILSPAILYDDLKTASVIQDASVGILVPPKNYDAFVEAAYWLMHLSPETKLTMSLIARQQALKHTWTKRIAEMKLFIEEDL